MGLPHNRKERHGHGCAARREAPGGERLRGRARVGVKAVGRSEEIYVESIAQERDLAVVGSSAPPRGAAALGLDEGGGERAVRDDAEAGEREVADRGREGVPEAVYSELIRGGGRVRLAERREEVRDGGAERERELARHGGAVRGLNGDGDLQGRQGDRAEVSAENLKTDGHNQCEVVSHGEAAPSSSRTPAQKRRRL